MRKLLLFLMLLIAAAPPLLAQGIGGMTSFTLNGETVTLTSENFDSNNNKIGTGVGSSANPISIPTNKLVELKIVTTSPITGYYGETTPIYIGDLDPIQGMTFTQGTDLNSGSFIFTDPIGIKEVTIDVNLESGLNPYFNFYIDVVDGDAGPALSTPELAVTTDLNIKDSNVFMKDLTLNVTMPEGSPVPTNLYYYLSTSNLDQILVPDPKGEFSKTLKDSDGNQIDAQGNILGNFQVVDKTDPIAYYSTGANGGAQNTTVLTSSQMNFNKTDQGISYADGHKEGYLYKVFGDRKYNNIGVKTDYKVYGYSYGKLYEVDENFDNIKDDKNTLIPIKDASGNQIEGYYVDKNKTLDLYQYNTWIPEDGTNNEGESTVKAWYKVTDLIDFGYDDNLGYNYKIYYPENAAELGLTENQYLLFQSNVKAEPQNFRLAEGVNEFTLGEPIVLTDVQFKDKESFNVQVIAAITEPATESGSDSDSETDAQAAETGFKVLQYKEVSSSSEYTHLFPVKFTTKTQITGQMPETVDVTGTETAPYDFTAVEENQTNEQKLTVVSSVALPEGVKAYYSLDGGEAVELTGDIDLTKQIGKKQVEAWYEYTPAAAEPTEGEEVETPAPLKSSILEAWVLLATPTAPAAPVARFGGREMNDGGHNSTTIVNAATTPLTFTKVDGVNIYYTITEGDTTSEETLYNADNEEDYKGIVFDKIGTYTVTAKAVLAGYAEEIASDPMTVTISITGADAPEFYLNSEQNDPAGGKTINAFVGDKLIVKLFEDCKLEYTVKEGEETSEPIALEASKATPGEIELTKTGTFVYTASTYFEEYPSMLTDEVVTVNVLAAPTVAINEESGAVEITSDENATTYWAIMLPDGEVDNAEAIAALKYEEVGTEAIEPETPGYIFVYSEAPASVTETTEPAEGEETEPATQADAMTKSAYVGGETAKYAISTEGLKLVLRLPEAYYDETNLEGLDGVYFNKIASGEQVTMTLMQVAEDGSFVDFPEYGELTDLTLAASTDAKDVTANGNEIKATFENGGVYNLVAEWVNSEWYRSGESSEGATVNVFETINTADIVGADKATLENGNEVTFVTIAEEATEVTFPIPAGGILWYRIISIPKAEQAEGIRGKILARADEERTPGEDIAGFTKSEDGKVALDGNSGSILTITETKEGITSPISQYYYGTEADKEELLKDITTGIYGVGVDAEGVEYYDLNGLRVNGNELKAGIYVRVANGKATKVVVK